LNNRIDIVIKILYWDQSGVIYSEINYWVWNWLLLALLSHSNNLFIKIILQISKLIKLHTHFFQKG